MEEIKLTKEELERMYQYPPKDFEKETDFQRTHRMGRNSIINELIDKIEKSKQNQYKLNMENLGKFIDDIRKEIKWLNVTFEEVPFGETMVLTIPPSSKKYIVDTRKIGKIEYDTPMYSELLEMTIEHLKRFNESDENLNISDVMKRIEELIDEYKQAKIDITKCDNSFDFDTLERRIKSLKYLFIQIGVWKYVS